MAIDHDGCYRAQRGTPLPARSGRVGERSVTGAGSSNHPLGAAVGKQRQQRWSRNSSGRSIGAPAALFQRQKSMITGRAEDALPNASLIGEMPGCSGSGRQRLGTR